MTSDEYMSWFIFYRSTIPRLLQLFAKQGLRLGHQIGAGHPECLDAMLAYELINKVNVVGDSSKSWLKIGAKLMALKANAFQFFSEIR